MATMLPTSQLIELLQCPLCVQSLKTLEQELRDLEKGNGELDRLLNFRHLRKELVGDEPCYIKTLKLWT